MRVLILWIGFLLGSVLAAAPVTGEEALQAARTFLAERDSGSTAARLSATSTAWALAPLVDAERATVGYVASDGGAYLVMRADTDCPPVKFFATEGNYEALPPAFREILELELAAELEAVRSTPRTAATRAFGSEWARLLGAASLSSTTATTSSEDAGQRLLTTAVWNQGVPYNQLCPPAAGGPGGRAWAGCTATATAIILRYHRWPDRIAKDYAYETYRIADAGLEPYAWADMPATDLAVASGAAQQRAVARLLYHCAVLGDSEFGAAGTAAWIGSSRWKTYFKYTCSNLRFAEDHSLTDWMAMVRTDIDAGRPIFWAMWSASGGHAVVCDGYDGDHLVHLNLGWSGAANGWYDLRGAVVAGGYSFRATSHQAIFEIKPIGAIASAPTVIGQPKSQAVAPGDPVTFSVEADGYPEPTYQWYRAGVALPGATGAAWSIPAAQASDAGEYRVVVANASGSVSSALATLTLAAAPRFVVEPADAAVEIGRPVEFSVEAVGAPAPTYQWYLNGTPVAGATGAAFGTFTVEGYHDGWTFQCVATNGHGSVASRAATLKVAPRPSPVIADQPTSYWAPEGQPARLEIAVEGATEIHWFRNGRAVGSSGDTLALPALSAADAGLYDCLARGPGGDTLAAPIVVAPVPAAGLRTCGSVTTRPEWQDLRLANGAIYDQFLLAGNAGTFTADPGQIARMSFLDLNGSIVQVEMSGAGAITVVLDPDTAVGPTAPALYNQTGVAYMQGHATILLVGADRTTHFTIYSVGTLTNPGVTKPDAPYAGWATIAAAGVASVDGALGGIHQGNVAYRAAVGHTGLYAPEVETVGGTVVIHDIAASANAQAHLRFARGGAVAVKIAGGSLAQPNGDRVTVCGLAQVTMGAGQDSCGRLAPAQSLASALLDADDGTLPAIALAGW